MMKTLFRGVGSGFGRVLGRFICYLFIGFVLYVLVKALGIDISSYIPKIGRLIL